MMNTSSPETSSIDILDETLLLALQLKKCAENNQKLSALKGYEELLNKIAELVLELNAQTEHIVTAYSTASSVRNGLHSLHTTLLDIHDLFDEIENTAVFFMNKSRFKRKMKHLETSLRTKSTQLTTSITLELMLASKSSSANIVESVSQPIAVEKSIETAPTSRKRLAKPPPAIPNTKSADIRSDTVVNRQLPLYYLHLYGISGLPRNLSHAFAAAIQAASTGDLEAMALVSLSFKEGYGVPIDLRRARVWLEAAATLGHPEAIFQLAESIICEVKNKRSACQRILGTSMDTIDLAKRSDITATQSQLSGRHVSSDSSDLIESKSHFESTENETETETDDFLMQRAMSLLLEATEKGVSSASTTLGSLYEEIQDYERAMKCYNVAAKGGCPKGTNCLGLLYFYGRGVNQYYEAAYNLFLTAAMDGDKTACNNVGMCFEHGLGTPKNTEEAVRFYELGAKSGCENAMYSLGYIRMRQYLDTMRELEINGKSSESLSQSTTSIVLPRCSTDDAGGSSITASTCATETKTVDPDAPASFRRFVRFPESEPLRAPTAAVAAGAAPTVESVQHRLSRPDKDTLESMAGEGLRWLRAAAEAGVAAAGYQLGLLYEQGTCVPLDPYAAYSQYQWAASSGGHCKAALKTAHMKYSGVGTEEDKSGALHYYLIAAYGGMAEAMNSAAILLEDRYDPTDWGDERGYGEQTLRAAAKWFLSASELGIQHAALNLVTLLSKGIITRFKSLSGEIWDIARVKLWFAENLTLSASLNSKFRVAMTQLDIAVELMKSAPDDFDGRDCDGDVESDEGVDGLHDLRNKKTRRRGEGDGRDLDNMQSEVDDYDSGVRLGPHGARDNSRTVSRESRTSRSSSSSTSEVFRLKTQDRVLWADHALAAVEKSGATIRDIAPTATAPSTTSFTTSFTASTKPHLKSTGTVAANVQSQQRSKFDEDEHKSSEEDDNSEEEEDEEGDGVHDSGDEINDVTSTGKISGVGSGEQNGCSQGQMPIFDITGDGRFLARKSSHENGNLDLSHRAQQSFDASQAHLNNESLRDLHYPSSTSLLSYSTTKPIFPPTLAPAVHLRPAPLPVDAPQRPIVEGAGEAPGRTPKTNSNVKVRSNANPIAEASATMTPSSSLSSLLMRSPQMSIASKEPSISSAPPPPSHLPYSADSKGSATPVARLGGKTASIEQTPSSLYRPPHPSAAGKNPDDDDVDDEDETS